MFKKTISIIILANLCLYIWQTALNISLSTQGDLLSECTRQVNLLKNQVDHLNKEISFQSSLNNIYPQAISLGFVPAQIARLTTLLAQASLK